MLNPYSVLGVNESATDEEIAVAYKKLARKYHPDLNPGDKEAELKMKELNSAYDLIKDIRSGKANNTYNSQYQNPYENTYARPNGGFYGFYWNMGAQQNDENGRYTRRRSFSLLKGIIVFLVLQMLFSFFLRGCSIINYYFNSEYDGFGRYSSGYHEVQNVEQDNNK